MRESKRKRKLFFLFFWLRVIRKLYTIPYIFMDVFSYIFQINVSHDVLVRFGPNFFYNVNEHDMSLH
jgi:hypothetical protein